MKANFKVIGLAVVVIILAFSAFNYFKPSKNGLDTHVFKTQTGYGYDITDHGKTIIKQRYIPALNEQIAFCNPKDAEKIGDRVVEKILLKVNPAISMKELQDAGISLHCAN
ncbi:MAG: DUF4907 domain-containing protein [Leeuwenhoekiella sp.]